MISLLISSKTRWASAGSIVSPDRIWLDEWHVGHLSSTLTAACQHILDVRKNEGGYPPDCRSFKEGTKRNIGKNRQTSASGFLRSGRVLPQGTAGAGRVDMRPARPIP